MSILLIFIEIYLIVTNMDDTKKNLSQIEKLVAVAAAACEFNHATQRMPNIGWRVIVNDMNVLKNV